MALSLRLAAFLVLETPEVFLIFQPFLVLVIGIITYECFQNDTLIYLIIFH